MAMPLFEIVPNLSEGRDPATIDAAVDAVLATGARVLHRTSDPVHHRSVLTVAGDGPHVLDAAVALAGVAVERIDLRKHRGIHPRIGALDVLPFVPLRDASMDDAAALAHEAGARIWDRYRVPSFFYGAAARAPQRASSPTCVPASSKGSKRASLVCRRTSARFARHDRAGAIAIGARNLLVAFNVELHSDDLALAKTIARSLRERNGGLSGLRALGLRLSEGVVQVSLNVTDVEATPLYRIVELIARLAAKNGVAIRRSELIGLVPRACVEASARYYLGTL